MGMTMSQKILAAHAGLDEVKAGQLINAKLDMVLGNDVTSPVAINVFEENGATAVFDNTKIAMIMDHFTPNKDIKAATLVKQTRTFADKYDIKNFMDVGMMGIEHALLPEKGLVDKKNEALREKLEDILPYYMIPTHFVHLDALPRTTTGKISRRLLPRPIVESRAYVAPGNDTERALCDAMASALGLERFGAEDDFYALGGSSVTSMEVVGTCGLAGLSINQIFRGRTPKRIAEYYLEALSKAKTVAFDKTGTMTKGVFEVNGIHHSSIDNEKLLEVAKRIREMREISGFSVEEMAEKTEVTVSEYNAYENGTEDFPFTFIHKCALAFGLGITDILEGESARLKSYTVTRRGGAFPSSTSLRCSRTRSLNRTSASMTTTNRFRISLSI